MHRERDGRCAQAFGVRSSSTAPGPRALFNCWAWRNGGLSGLSRRPRAQDGQSGCPQGVRDRAGMEEWSSMVSRHSLLGATRSDKSQDRLYQLAVKGDPCGDQERISGHNGERTVGVSVSHVVEETLQVTFDVHPERIEVTVLVPQILEQIVEAT